jgi:hypothetical protein
VARATVGNAATGTIVAPSSPRTACSTATVSITDVASMRTSRSQPRTTR